MVEEGIFDNDDKIQISISQPSMGVQFVSDECGIYQNIKQFHFSLYTKKLNNLNF